MIIYKITNKSNGKCYIGQTISSLHTRMKKHLNAVKNDSKLFIHNAIRKYGEENFTWEVLEKCNTRKELDEMEFHYIKQYNSYWTENGYNLSYGGDGNGGLFGEVNGMYGKKHSSSSIEKMKKNRKGITIGNKNPSSKNAGLYKVTFPDGEVKEIKNMKKFCRENNLNCLFFYQMCNGKKTKKFKGYWCERISMPSFMKRDK